MVGIPAHRRITLKEYHPKCLLHSSSHPHLPSPLRNTTTTTVSHHPLYHHPINLSSSYNHPILLSPLRNITTARLPPPLYHHLISLITLKSPLSLPPLHNTTTTPTVYHHPINLLSPHGPIHVNTPTISLSASNHNTALTLLRCSFVTVPGSHSSPRV